MPESGREPTVKTRRRHMDATRGAALLYVTLGAGFGVGSAVTMVYLAREGELPMTPFGFRSMGGGPFERLGTPALEVLGWTLVGVCALDVIAGIWLWQGRRRGTRLGLATSLPALVLGAGFALPFLVVGVPVRTALVLLGRRTTH
jgi:hypothetical protein